MNKKIIIPALVVLILAIIAGIVFISTNKKYEIPILMYHHLCESEKDVNSQTVTAEKFESDLKWLSENGYRTILPREMVENKSKHGYIPNGKEVILTFDDGYKSNYELAFPLLKKYNAKAEISVITFMIDDSDLIHPYFCNWDMLKEMTESGLVEIGSHSDNMHNPDNNGEMYSSEANGLKRYTKEEALADAKASFEKIKNGTGRAPATFAYPYGEINKDAEKQLGEYFPVTMITATRMANTWKDFTRLGRFRIDQNTNLSDILN